MTDEALQTMSPGKMFAEFGVRMVAIGIDFWVALFLAQGLKTYLIEPLGFGLPDQKLLVAGVLLVYFTASWLSPLLATPVQFLFGMRVVNEQGKKLGTPQAIVRAVVLVALVEGAFALFELPVRIWLVVVGLAAYGFLFLAALTPNRQALHDKFAKSIVVNKAALFSRNIEQLREHTANMCAKTWWQRKPSIVTMIGNAIVLILPVVVLTNVAAIQNAKDLHYRTAYAVSETQGMKIAIAEYYLWKEQWPNKGDDIGAPGRVDYPDGGYYELEDNGTIRIRFEVKPELVKGSLAITPTEIDGTFDWRCTMEGAIERQFLTALCRE